MSLLLLDSVASGQSNFYAYAGNDPTNEVDLSGLGSIVQEKGAHDLNILYYQPSGAASLFYEPSYIGTLHPDGWGERKNRFAKLANVQDALPSFGQPDWDAWFAENGKTKHELWEDQSRKDNIQFKMDIWETISSREDIEAALPWIKLLAGFAIEWTAGGGFAFVSPSTQTRIFLNNTRQIAELSKTAKGKQEVQAALAAIKAGCFPPETLVATQTGLRPIGEIEAGQRVWSFDFEAGTWGLCVVEARHDLDYLGPIVTIEMGFGKVSATAHHPFWVIQGRNLAGRPPLEHLASSEDCDKSLPGRWVNSHDLQEGDIVFLRGLGPTKVGCITERMAHTPVCNLTVLGLHNLAVGTMQVLVHNAPPCAAAGTAPVRPLGLGSTANLRNGTTLARNLREQFAIEQAISNPAAGNRLPITLGDARWSAADGWVKMEQVIQSAGREGPIRVHYVYNTITGAIDDFKIVLQGAR